MSIDGTTLLFEGFLQKRKDTLKIRWVTYWFRLQNATLFFYTKENGSASHLRGYYYIYTVQSVREIMRADSKRFMFEIIMTSGKRKMLAAETEALRKEWVGHLWQAMHLSSSVVSEASGTHPEESQLRDRINSITPICSHSESVMDSLPPRPLSAPDPSVLVRRETRSKASPIDTSEDEEEAIYLNTTSALNYQYQNVDSLKNPQWSSELSDTEDREEGDYDVLPTRNKTCESSRSPEMEEGVYDVPLSYRSSAEYQDQAESVYDTPSSLLRKMPDHTIEENSSEELYWMI